MEVWYMFHVMIEASGGCSHFCSWILKIVNNKFPFAVVC